MWALFLCNFLPPTILLHYYLSSGVQDTGVMVLGHRFDLTCMNVVANELCHTSTLVLGVFVSLVHKQHHEENVGMESSCGHSIH